MTRQDFLDKMLAKKKIDQVRYDTGLAKLKDKDTRLAKAKGDKTKLSKAELIAMVDTLTV